MAATIGSYKGHATISLTGAGSNGDRYPFTFGVSKAELILANLDAIKAFVARHGVKAPAPAPDRFDMAVEDQGARQCGLI